MVAAASSLLTSASYVTGYSDAKSAYANFSKGNYRSALDDISICCLKVGALALTAILGYNYLTSSSTPKEEKSTAFDKFFSGGAQVLNPDGSFSSDDDHSYLSLLLFGTEPPQVIKGVEKLAMGPLVFSAPKAAPPLINVPKTLKGILKDPNAAKKTSYLAQGLAFVGLGKRISFAEESPVQFYDSQVTSESGLPEYVDKFFHYGKYDWKSSGLTLNQLVSLADKTISRRRELRRRR